MLLNRSALEVVRLCAKPEDDAVAAVTHVFVDEDGRVCASDGVLALRAMGTVEKVPDLFTESVGVDEVVSCALPGAMVSDFLKAWRGKHVVVREPKPNTVSMETTDGDTSCAFEAPQKVVKMPGFDRVLAHPGKKSKHVVKLSVDELLQLARTTKALGATALELTFHEDPVAPIHIAASVEGVDAAIEGALMPMRE